MRMLIVDASTKKPAMNAKVQLQIKGKDSGFLTLSTDTSGGVHLDDKYNGQQVTLTFNGIPGQWTTAKEGQTMLLSKQTEKTKETHHK
jgi:hypothetical protein